MVARLEARDLLAGRLDLARELAAQDVDPGFAEAKVHARKEEQWQRHVELAARDILETARYQIPVGYRCRMHANQHLAAFRGRRRDVCDAENFRRPELGQHVVVMLHRRRDLLEFEDLWRAIAIENDCLHLNLHVD